MQMNLLSGPDLSKRMPSGNGGYEFHNRDGGTMTKHRPEHQMLVESRSKYLVVLKELGMTPAARKRIEVDVEIDDELENLLKFKDA